MFSNYNKKIIKLYKEGHETLYPMYGNDVNYCIKEDVIRKSVSCILLAWYCVIHRLHDLTNNSSKNNSVFSHTENISFISAKNGTFWVKMQIFSSFYV